ncbi:hypothetical protein [Falsiroseomonas stagni]|uniref:Lipoprotein n=1 Tax=Falsiroseomonas stagni DSM 19981 TaxID=1123062 RepID=A0A1I4DEL2_9PROT|nr:hypothetical protein [Falsiroseomonas stagni]SFK91483.1 hypothetical protein SAMN02745775_110163 [Falsiroseomonas stagni DSM 19981]
MIRRGALGVLAGAALMLGACTPQQPQQVVVVQQPVSQACDTSFVVVNNSGATVERLYFSHSSLGGWGNDQLGQSVLPPGRQVSYRAANTGNYDFRVVWTNGRAAEIRGVNVCRASRITVTNGGLLAS